jgi:hypothetical protein
LWKNSSFLWTNKIFNYLNIVGIFSLKLSSSYDHGSFFSQSSRRKLAIKTKLYMPWMNEVQKKSITMHFVTCCLVMKKKQEILLGKYFYWPLNELFMNLTRTMRQVHSLSIIILFLVYPSSCFITLFILWLQTYSYNLFHSLNCCFSI